MKKNEKAFAGEDIQLNYNYKDGKFEVDSVPKTAMQAEIMLKNGGIKSTGKNIIIAIPETPSAGFKLEQLNNEDSGSNPTGMAVPVLKYSDNETLSNSVASMKLTDGRLERPTGGSNIAVYEYEFGQKQGPCVLTFAHKRGNLATEIYKFNLFSKDESIEIKSKETFYNGDATMDGKINIFDAVKIAKSTLNDLELNSEQKLLADSNKSGTIDIFDAVDVAKKTV